MQPLGVSVRVVAADPGHHLELRRGQGLLPQEGIRGPGRVAKHAPRQALMGCFCLFPQPPVLLSVLIFTLDV